jgi:hypothetical protein
VVPSANGEPSAQGSPIDVLILAANPQVTSRLRLDEEHRAIENSLRGTGRRGAVRTFARFAATAADLREALQEVRPHILHYCGHGENQGLILASDQGADAGARLSNEDLAETLRILRGRIELVVLNACSSSSAAALAVRAVGCVVAMDDAVDDQAAVRFAAELYRSLAFGRSVQDAFGLARLALTERERDVPRLHRALDVDPARLVLIPPQNVVTADAVARALNPIDPKTTSVKALLQSIRFAGVFENVPWKLTRELAQVIDSPREAVNLVFEAGLLLREYCPGERALPPADVPDYNASSAWEAVVRRAPGYGARALAAVLLCVRDRRASTTLPEVDETLRRLVAASAPA